MAAIDCIECGAELEVPEDRSTWDVTTKLLAGVECIVERHVSVTCEACGTTAHPFLPYGSDHAAQAGRDLLAGHFGHLAGENGSIPEIANIVREVIDPPEPFGARTADG